MAVAALLVASAVGIAVAAPPETIMEKQPLQVLNRQVDAWNQGDLVAFMGTYWKSENLTFSAGGRTERGWQATLDRYRRRYPDREAMGVLSFDQLELTELAPDAALVLGRWQLKRGDETLQGNFSLVMRKMDGNWLIIHDHSSSLEN